MLGYMAGRPRSTLKKLARYSAISEKLANRFFEAMPVQYRDLDRSNESDRIAEAWIQAMHSIADAFRELKELERFIKRKVNQHPPRPLPSHFRRGKSGGAISARPE
jgi:hypothetical protein